MIALLSLLCACTTSTQAIKERKAVGAFHAISSASGIDVYYTQADSCSVTIEASDKAMDNIVVNVEDGTLVLRMKSNSGFLTGFFAGVSPLKAYVSAPVIDDVSLSGGGDFYASQLINQTAVSINASGGSDVHCDRVSTVDCRLSFLDGCDCSIKQMDAKNLSINASGGSDMKIQINDAASVDIHASGGSDIKLTGKANALTADASGASDIDVTGLLVQTINANTSGSGSVKRQK